MCNNLAFKCLKLSPEKCNSPVKRLTLIVTACTGLAGFVYASAELYNDIISSTWNKVFDLVTSYTYFV